MFESKKGREFKNIIPLIKDYDEPAFGPEEKTPGGPDLGRRHLDPVTPGDLHGYHASRPAWEEELRRQQIERLTGEVASLRSQLTATKERLADEAVSLRSQLRDAEERVRQANLTIFEANRAIKGLRAELGIAEQRAATASSQSRDTDPSFAALGLDPRTAFVGLTEEQIQAVVASAQRTRARFIHPDRGGDTKAMQRVNSAADALKHPSSRGKHQR